MTYNLKGVCPSSINLEIEGGIIRNLSFEGGCNGNLKGLSSLAIGQNAQTVAEKLKGTTCGMKKTSCPDQLATIIEQTLTAKN